MRQIALWSSLLAVLWPIGAAAQDPPSVAVLRTASGGGASSELASTIDRALRASITRHGGVEVRGSVALDLGDVQLALGCEGDTRACLGAVAQELGVQRLVLSNLDRTGSVLVLQVALFDASSGEEPARASRQAPLEDPAPLLSELDALVQELLGPAPQAPRDHARPDDAAEPRSEPTAPSPSRGVDGDVIGGAVLLAIGGGTLAAAIGLGLASMNERDAYVAQATPTEADADRALGHLRSASDLALGANLAFAIGGTVALGGLVWLIVGLVSGNPPGEVPAVTATAWVSESSAGVAVGGALPRGSL